MTQGQILANFNQVWIQSFPSPRLFASPRLKNLVCPTIYLWLYHSQIWICEMDLQCPHIYNVEHRNLETRKNTYDFLVQVRNFLLPLSLKVLRHKERDTHSFYSGFSIAPPPHLVRHLPKALHEQAKVNRLLPRQDSTELTDFFKISKILCAFPVRDVTRTLSPRFPSGLLWYL